MSLVRPPRSALPPPRRAGLRFPTPLGHGRGLVARPGCAKPDHASVSIVTQSLPWEAATACSPPGFGRCRGKPAWQAVSANTLAHPTIDVMQSSRARRVYSPLPLRLRLHNAGYYPTCQPVAAVRGRITLRDRLCRLRSGASLFGMSGRVFKRSALFLAIRRQTGPPPRCGEFGRRCGPHRS